MLYSKGEEYLRTKYSDYDIIRIDAVVTVGDVSKEVVMQYVQDQLTKFNAGRSRRDSSPG